ncbi:tRNA 2-thiouridine synthesizing protein C [Modicisalibacter ilicicola DSM 19980]|uniref:tRNA 2-thiouridine synthesizing protein C n=1 Tax=Modicisalibacter ilicicola DSM 19980 TaxID=1121942 RepID=A0A1M5E193_9GAMM|nr:sulfurtransferase complex subunit TusC [Halomonas ilicicola]SHF72940.1 tRNA 2-thiouridine synthesizing protein C [Halomonas ilicicola DSM 19980]
MSDRSPMPMLVVLRHAPHGSSWLREGLDVALVGAAFGQSVTLLFIGDGVEALVKGQQTGPLGQKGTHPTLDMLAMYDIETLLVDAESLAQRGLIETDLQLPVTLVAPERLPSLFAHHAPVFNF